MSGWTSWGAGSLAFVAIAERSLEPWEVVSFPGAVRRSAVPCHRFIPNGGRNERVSDREIPVVVFFSALKKTLVFFMIQFDHRLAYYVYICLPSLKLTASLHLKHWGWFRWVSLWGPWPPGRCKLSVSFGECKWMVPKPSNLGTHDVSIRRFCFFWYRSMNGLIF